MSHTWVLVLIFPWNISPNNSLLFRSESWVLFYSFELILSWISWVVNSQVIWWQSIGPFDSMWWRLVPQAWWKSFLFSRPNIWILWPILLIWPVQLVTALSWWAPTSVLLVSAHSGSISVRLCFFSLVNNFLMWYVSGKLCCSFTHRVLGNYLAKEFSSQVRIFTRVLGVHTLGPSVWGKLCCSFTHRVLGNSHPHPPNSYSRMVRWASQPNIQT